MKSLFYLLLGIISFTATAVHAQAPVATLHVVEENGPRSKQLNFVYLSEGYTSDQMGAFAADVQTAVNYLFSREPWVRYRSHCNVYRIEVASAQSGTDYGEAGGLRDTYFHSYFDPGSDRLNVISSAGSARAYSLLNKHVPEYDVPIVIVNDPKYGGSGGPIAVATTNEWSPGLVEHEIGHSFADLADEYDFIATGYTRLEFANATSQTAFANIPWKLWIESGTPVPDTPEDHDLWRDKVGHFKGANYRPDTSYRAHDYSMMRVLSHPSVGPVNREAFTLKMYARIPLFKTFAPAALTQTLDKPTDIKFEIEPKIPTSGPALTVSWEVDGAPMPSVTGNSWETNTEVFGNGVHKIKAIVRDPTDWVRRDPAGLLVEEVTWTLNLSKQQLRAPTITTPLPTPRVLAVGNSLMLDATATGPGPITYQWLRNNAPLKPAVTTPTLNIGPVTLADAGTLSVKVTNPLHTVTYNCVLAVLDPNVPRVVAAKGKTATLAFAASTNIPAVSWEFGVTPIVNGAHYAAATTKALQIKNVDVGDSGTYFFDCENYGPSPAVQLLVVTGETNYTGTTPTLPVGIVGAYYNEPFPLPADELKTPNSFAGTLPGGLKMDAKTGRITGIPTVPSKNQVEGDEITFTVGNEFGKKVPVKIKLLIKSLPGGAGIYSGLVMLHSQLGSATGGRMDITVMSTGSYSGTAVIGSDTLRFSGQFHTSGPAATVAMSTQIFKPKHLPGGLFLPIRLTDDADADPLTGTIADDTNQNFFAWRNKWLAPESVDTFKGYHTFAFSVPAGSSTSVPKGHGFGSVTIDATGKSVVSGKLADGETFATTSHVSPAGELIIYQTLYTTVTKGSIIAVLNLDPGVGAAPSFFTPGSAAYWSRPLGTTRLYKDGFTPLQMDVFGGLYTPPGKTEIIMGLPAASGSPLKNALLGFDSILGDDPLPVDVNVGLEIKPGGTTKVNSNPKAVTFSVTPLDGRFKGSYTTKDNDPRPPLSATPRPQISRKVDYQGIIVRQDGVLKGYGFFLRDALPKADGSTTPTTSPKHSGALLLRNSNL